MNQVLERLLEQDLQVYQLKVRLRELGNEEDTTVKDADGAAHEGDASSLKLWNEPSSDSASNGSAVPARRQLGVIFPAHAECSCYGSTWSVIKWDGGASAWLQQPLGHEEAVTVTVTVTVIKPPKRQPTPDMKKADAVLQRNHNGVRNGGLRRNSLHRRRRKRQSALLAFLSSRPDQSPPHHHRRPPLWYSSL
jgi:hypothetical protein